MQGSLSVDSLREEQLGLSCFGCPAAGGPPFNVVPVVREEAQGARLEGPGLCQGSLRGALRGVARQEAALVPASTELWR